MWARGGCVGLAVGYALRFVEENVLMVAIGGAIIVLMLGSFLYLGCQKANRRKLSPEAMRAAQHRVRSPRRLARVQATGDNLLTCLPATDLGRSTMLRAAIQVEWLRFAQPAAQEPARQEPADVAADGNVDHFQLLDAARWQQQHQQQLLYVDRGHPVRCMARWEERN